MSAAPAKPTGPARKGSTLADHFVLSDVVSHLLRRAHFRAENLFDAELGGRDLTPRQKALLVTAHQHPGETQSLLADRVALDRASFAEMLRRMTARGLLRRVAANNDKRAYAIFMTPKGEALLQAVLPLDRVVEERVIAPLPPEYRPLFIKCLKLMVGVDADAERTGRRRPSAGATRSRPSR